MSHSLEFEFLGDEQDGQFVPVGGPLAQLRNLLARQDVDGAVRLYEETGSSARAGLVQEAVAASFELKKSIALMFKKARPSAEAPHPYLRRPYSGGCWRILPPSLAKTARAACPRPIFPAWKQPEQLV